MLSTVDANVCKSISLFDSRALIAWGLTGINPKSVVRIVSKSGTVRVGNIIRSTRSGDIIFRLISEERANGVIRKFEPGTEPKILLHLDGHDVKKNPIQTGPFQSGYHRFPVGTQTSDWPSHVEVFRSRGITPEMARVVGEALVSKLDLIALDLRALLERRSPNDPSNNPALDVGMRLLLSRLNDSTLLGGTGYRSDDHNQELTLGKADITNWVRSAQQLAYAADALARKAAVSPGKLTPPDYHQFLWHEGHMQFVDRFGPEDQNNRQLYAELILVTLEEHYHIAQNLLYYSGLRGPAASVSHWSRTSNADHDIDAEADVMATLMERVGPLGAYWRGRYPSRSFVPQSLRQTMTPGLSP